MSDPASGEDSVSPSLPRDASLAASGDGRAVARVLLVDDHTAFRESLAFMLGREPSMEVVAQAGTLAEARLLLEGVDVAVLDAGPPDGDGTDLAGELRAKSPDAFSLVLTASLDPWVHARAVEAGASGFLHKSARIGEVVHAVRRLVAGETLLTGEEVVKMARLVGERREEDREAQRIVDRLTPRERDVLQALADGLNDKQMASRLHVSPGTARNYVAKLIAKLGVRSRLQALLFAVRYGLVEIR